ncbi:hypothetical protein LOC54_07965 [Acetobacter sp. AN02]|uniref:hypothetical protein n=1 Tax=Acetobacter sp. AN02 TaxID=2894186 RepID=UPI0024341A4D|nr:hypothetical protein [Acetobacter sp. AN02]MDG6095044.1 hypothetical protein [Acetobacter sp. AN02]
MIRRLALMTAVLLPLAAGMTGYAAAQDTSAALPKPAIWSVSVQGCEEASRCDDLRDGLAQELSSRGYAQRIAQAGEPADLHLDVTVSRLHVRTSVHSGRGVAAKKNRVEATETVKNSSGATLRNFKVSTSFPAHHYGVSSVKA